MTTNIFYRVTWWTKTTNGQLRAYSHSVPDKAKGLQFIEHKRHAPNVCSLFLMRDEARIMTGERFATDYELNK